MSTLDDQPSGNPQNSIATELPKEYLPIAVQERCRAIWEAGRYFHAEADDPRQAFSVVIPPPNVTGALHLGHALNNSLQDVLVRWRRMAGDAVLWVPGTDHAGIATQAVVERRLLQEEKLSRHDLGREALVERIWAWKHEYEARILGQLQQMGCSCDWTRTRFTLDDVCARAVRHTFFHMFRDGLVYRGKRLVNWDTYLQTAVSDDEVFHETVAGSFWHFSYPVVDPRPGEPHRVIIATTRPETMLGDTAVAVHPDPDAALDQVEVELRDKLAAAQAKDQAAIKAELESLAERREKLLPTLRTLRDMAADGRCVRLPLSDREIPLVADEWAKPELGSGCVKITPAHDPNDYEVGKRQDLPMLNVLNPDGTINAAGGVYEGLSIQDARKKVVDDMDALGHLVQIEDRQIDIAHSDRSKTPIEPYLADQWFVAMNDLAQTAMDAVSDGRVKIVPERYARGYLDWLSEKRDWPVSRQLWWGHQIPIWYAEGVDEQAVKTAFAGRGDVVWRRDEEVGDRWLICVLEGELAPEAVAGCTLRQEEDVLDTWFSSALWPHSTLGWPEETPELKKFYPTSILVTSRDIITLWVARMVLAGLYNVGEVPFGEVYIHPKILDGYGEGMSKSKGNGVDPLAVIRRFGADALRFALVHLCTETQDVRMPVEFECPHCQKLIPQTKKNRMLPRIECDGCGNPFSTQWAVKSEDLRLDDGAVVSDRFKLAAAFCNKLWNAARFVMMNLEGYTAAEVQPESLELEDRWLLSRLAAVTQQTTAALEARKFAEIARTVHDFAWDEFCSFYVEMSKLGLQDEQRRPVTQRLLAHALDVILRLLHPIAPFITEEIWQLLGEIANERGLQPEAAAESVMIAAWPVADESFLDAEIEARFARFQEALGALRELRSRQGIAPKQPVEFVVRTDGPTAELLRPMTGYFDAMARGRAAAIGADAAPPPLSSSSVLSGMEVFLDLAGHIDVAAELARGEKELAKLQAAVVGKEKKLSNEQFTANAPPEVVARERESLAELQGRVAAQQTANEQLRAAAK